MCHGHRATRQHQRCASRINFRSSKQSDVSLQNACSSSEHSVALLNCGISVWFMKQNTERSEVCSETGFQRSLHSMVTGPSQNRLQTVNCLSQLLRWRISCQSLWPSLCLHTYQAAVLFLLQPPTYPQPLSQSPYIPSVRPCVGVGVQGIQYYVNIYI